MKVHNSSPSSSQQPVEEDDDDPGASPLMRILHRSITFRQLSHKISSVFRINIHSTKWIEVGNIIMLMLFDLAIGVLLSNYVSTAMPNLYEVVHGKIEALLVLLLQILDWLSGAPAGLKLNASLNSLLGRFFSYNLHLWRNYIKILEPVLKFLLTAITYSGLYVGFSVQAALIKDIVSVTTFHIYCLYIYATRLFNIELYALKSLGHLFFGRKWNPLRNRIDHVQLNRSEMFLSSLAFTIAVFLLPTLIVYYIVFLGLRLPILLVESILKFIIHVVNSTEIVTILLVLLKPSVVPHDTYLHPLPTGEFRRHPDTSSSSCSKDRDGRIVEVDLPVVRYEIRTRPIYRIKLPSIGKYLKEIVVRILKSQVITH